MSDLPALSLDPPLARRDGAAIYHAAWADLAAAFAASGAMANALIVDAPYSERTHGGQRHGRRNETKASGEWVSARGLDYAHWTPGDVSEFVAAWAPLVTGWIVSLTDSELYPAWRDATERAGRLSFAPLPVVQIGMNIRLAGDGPSNWTCWAAVSRPRTAQAARWGTLRGAYVGGQEHHKTRAARVVGGKPLWLMERLVEDYSRPGDLIVDPCCGAGTTVLAAMHTGRRGIGCDIDAAHAAMAAKRISGAVQAPLFVAGDGAAGEQLPLAAEGEK